MSRFAVTLLCVTFVLLGASAFAVDGTVLINQAAVNAAGGFPYVISQPGSYKLSGNLTVPAGSANGIEIRADYVTLDLNGFHIAGPNTCTVSAGRATSCVAATSGMGVRAVSSTNVTVLNGSISGMQYGVRLDGADGAGHRVEGVHADHNTSAGIYAIGSVKGCSASFNGGIGIEGRSGVFEGNTAVGNENIGIDLGSGSALNNVSMNNDLGLLLGNAAYAGNTLLNNATSDLLIENSVSTTNLCTSGPC